jgi:hypothetical protein
MKSFVESRRLTLKEKEKCLFFDHLESATTGQSTLELIKLSDTCCTKICSADSVYQLSRHVRNFTDVILIALNKNQQLVKAVVANFREGQR